MVKVVTAFDRPCIPADCIATSAHILPVCSLRSALSGGRRNGLGARTTFTTDCYISPTATPYPAGSNARTWTVWFPWRSSGCFWRRRPDGWSRPEWPDRKRSSVQSAMILPSTPLSSLAARNKGVPVGRSSGSGRCRGAVSREHDRSSGDQFPSTSMGSRKMRNRSPESGLGLQLRRSAAVLRGSVP